MVTESTILTWQEALREFLLHLEATRAEKTRLFYQVQLGRLVAWTEEQHIPLEAFGKRHLDRYLVDRARAGLFPTTLHADALCAKALLRWCVKNDILERSLLAEHEIRKAPTPARYMPAEEVRNLLAAVQDYWSPAKNPDVRYHPLMRRTFHRDRNYAIILGLLDTACRINEMLSLKVEDYREGDRQILIRESKGREPRALPISRELAEAIGVWLRVRARVRVDAPDEGWLFVSEFGGRADSVSFLKAVKRCLHWAGLSEHITLHSLRRFSQSPLQVASTTPLPMW